MPILPNEKIDPVNVAEEMSKSFLDYSMSVIISRALPDARDGLKPSQRRILYAMNGLGLQPNRKHSKCAKIVGETMGNYHPHGDMAIYPTLVHMAQPWAMRETLIEGQGQLRFHGRRSSRVHAVHRSTADPSRRDPHGGYGKGYGRLCAELRRNDDRADRFSGSFSQSARQRRDRYRCRDGNEHSAPQPRGDRRRDLRADRSAGYRHRSVARVHQRSRFPDRMHHLRHERDSPIFRNRQGEP